MTRKDAELIKRLADMVGDFWRLIEMDCSPSSFKASRKEHPGDNTMDKARDLAYEAYKHLDLRAPTFSQ